MCLPVLGQHLTTCVQSALQTSCPSDRSDTYMLKWDVDEGYFLACANNLDWSCLLLRAFP